MVRNYFAIALRSIRQKPLYSFINIFSLSVGLAACLVIYLFVQNEQSFDTFHQKKAVIYRLDEVQNFPGTKEQKVALSMPGMAPALAREFPEVVTYTRFRNRDKQLFIKGENRMLVPRAAMVDSTYLDIFDFPLIAGDRTTVLDAPYTMAITESLALKFFKSTAEAFNNTLTYNNHDYIITAILKDIPENSHMQFDVLISLTTVTNTDKEFNDRWGSNSQYTYLVLHPATDIRAMEAKFPAFLSRHMNFPKVNEYYKLFLQPLTDVHLGSTDIEHDYDNYRKFNGKYLNVFYIIGGFILLIAAVNFMNLTTARASHRWKEIGVRQSVGARKVQLFGQFIFESTMLAVFALVLACIIDLLCIPLLNIAIGRHLELSAFLLDAGHVMMVLAGTLILGILTGIYPAFYMASANTAKAMKGKGNAEGRSVFRSSLVVVQFGLSLAMIVSTLIVLKQLSFMNNADIGFEKDQILLVDMNQEANKKFQTLKQELQQYDIIKGVTASGQRLGNNLHQWGFKVKSDTGILDITPSNLNVDYDFLKVYGIELKKGRGFSKEFASDNGMAFVINETFEKELALKETVGAPAGHSWYDKDSLGTIIGVVKDFNFNSLHHRVNTLSMVVHPDWGYDELTVKLAAGRTEEGLALVKKLWEQHVPSYPFEYTFLDQHFAVLYRSDKQMGVVVSIMAGLAIVISCVGLFGLAAITTEKKTKEIGIRKSLGATEAQITVLLSRNFAMLIILSFVLVSPLTYLLLQAWLQNFAYRVSINPLLFLAGGAVALTIALLTIGYHTIRSARANPVKALRYE